MKFRVLCIAAVMVAASNNRGRAAEEPKPPPGAALQREAYADSVAGYSLLLPTGYRKLSEDEIHGVFESLSQNFGEKMSERARKRPPAYFTGPDSQRVNNQSPPALTIAFTENVQQYDASQLANYKEQIEANNNRRGAKAGALNVSIVKVDGIDSLQVESDMVGPNNDRGRAIQLAVPAKGKTFDIAFTYIPEQTEAVHTALKEMLDSFKVMEHPPTNIANQDKWLRVTYITLGSGLAGLLLGFLLQKRKKSA